MLTDMGFDEDKARLAASNFQEIEAAISWFEDGADESVLPHPARLMQEEEEGEEGGQGQVQDTRTREEKEADLQRKLAERRRQREEEEKQAEVERERQRREAGKNIGRVQEDLEALQKKRDYEARRKEQQEERKERERLRALIQRDREERATHGGKLPSRLGVEGYTPSVGYDGGEEKGEEPATEPREQLHGMEAVEQYLVTLGRYRAGGDGGTAMKTVRAYLKNLLKDPQDERFQSINMDNNAFKTRVKPFVGGVQILQEVGFERRDEEGEKRLVLNLETFDEEFVSDVFAKLDEALQLYKQRNG
jgi:hypothetical protein